MYSSEYKLFLSSYKYVYASTLSSYKIVFELDCVINQNDFPNFGHLVIDGLLLRLTKVNYVHSFLLNISESKKLLKLLSSPSQIIFSSVSIDTFFLEFSIWFINVRSMFACHATSSCVRPFFILSSLILAPILAFIIIQRLRFL